MEFICPACGRFIEVRDSHVFGGKSFRCNECWSVLRIESLHPFRVRAQSKTADALANVAGPDVRGGGKLWLR